MTLISWLPNAISLGNLSLGFVVIVLSTQLSSELQSEKVVFCSVLILIAILLDGCDGFLARLLKAESDIGKYLDSFADMTVFGIAPALLYHQVYLQTYQYTTFNDVSLPVGIFVSMIYPVCIAYRLARFSIGQQGSVFTGLPSPVAGGLVASMCIMQLENQFAQFSIVILASISLLTISSVRYKKITIWMKDQLNIAKLSILLFLLILLLIFFEWYTVILYLFLLYTVSGALSFLLSSMPRT